MILTDEERAQLKLLSGDTVNNASNKPRQSHFRGDGYVNLLNKYGTPQDNATRYVYNSDGLVIDQVLISQYESNGLFARIIDAPAEEATRHEFSMCINNSDIEKYVKDTLDDLDWEIKISQAIKWARLFGGAIAVMIVDDGKELDEPLDWKGIKSIEEIKVYERAVVQPDYETIYNYTGIGNKTRTAPMGYPEFYEVTSIYGQFRVHHSRCLVFQNGIVPEQCTTEIYRFWGIPEYVRIKNALRETITAHSDAVKLLERCVQAIYKMKNLAQLLTTEEGENQALRRLQVIDMARGLLNSIAIDAEGESYEYQSFTLSGISEVIDATCNMLSAITNIPQTVLFGRSPAGMSATGESDFENYYNFIDRIRKTMIKSNIRKIIDIILRVGYVTGRISDIPIYKIEFDSLWSLSEQEQAVVDNQKAGTSQVKAQTAQIYVDMGALDPSEVREGLKSNDEYEIEDLIGEDADEELSEEEMQNLLNDVLSVENEEDITLHSENSQDASK